jgi:hypothetical protein
MNGSGFGGEAGGYGAGVVFFATVGALFLVVRIGRSRSI